MAVSVALNTPFAEALNNVVQPKLVEVGWSSDGGDDSALAEYVILMLVNGKTQEQIAGELSKDLLGLDDDTEAVNFAKWLFEQVDLLNQQLNGAPPASDSQPVEQAIPSTSNQEGDGATSGAGDMGGHDAEMGDVGASVQDGAVPTGPKAMRNNRQNGRGRMMGQISKAMDRSSDSVLHRVRSGQGTGRINSHDRQMPRGPRNGPGMNGRGPGGARQMSGNMGMGMGMPTGGPGAPMMQMNPQQQMQMMAMLEEQARMMAQLMPPGMVPPAINPAFQNGRQQQGRSLFDRVERGPQHRNGNFQKRGQAHGGSARPSNSGMDMDMEMGQNGSGPAETSSMDVEGGQQSDADPNSPCRFNLKCTKKDCPFAHSSPAAPEGTPIDASAVCPFGAACKNRKCVGRHPSPAQKVSHQAEELCRFFPHCTNPNCHFKHPSMPMCRNGADCTVSGCKFTHLQIPCRFNPCLNRSCPYKHVEGQKGSFGDKVWTADGAARKEAGHVSERKFVQDEGAEEELIKPGSESAPTETSQDATITT